MMVKPANNLFPEGSYIVVRDGVVIWRSPEIKSNLPAETAKRLSEEVRAEGGKLFFIVGGQ